MSDAIHREVYKRSPAAGKTVSRHQHYLAIGLQRIFLGDHHDCYRQFWDNGEATWTDHTFLHVSADLESWSDTLATYESGAPYDEGTWARGGYVGANHDDMARAGAYRYIIEV